MTSRPTYTTMLRTADVSIARHILICEHLKVQTRKDYPEQLKIIKMQRTRIDQPLHPTREDVNNRLYKFNLEIKQRIEGFKSAADAELRKHKDLESKAEEYLRVYTGTRRLEMLKDHLVRCRRYRVSYEEAMACAFGGL